MRALYILNAGPSNEPDIGGRFANKCARPPGDGDAVPLVGFRGD